MKKKSLILLILLFIVILSAGRIFWGNMFQADGVAPIEKGYVDMTDWDSSKEQVLLLDGEWEFYPFQLFFADGETLNTGSPSYIDVPEDWNQTLNPDDHDSFGYGSYRLLIQVDPEQSENYSLKIASIRSASEVYINGELLAYSGRVGQSVDEYEEKNLPYVTSFQADETGLIEIVIQASNFRDIRGSGLVRSIKFGPEQAILQNNLLSSFMQLLSAFILIVHAVYSLIVYFVSKRKENKLLYVSLGTFCLALTSLLSFDEKLFHHLFYIGYDWDFRITNAALILGMYAFLQCSDHQSIKYWNKLFPFYKWVTFGTIGLTLLSSVETIIQLFPLYYILLGIAIVIIAVAMFKKINEDFSAHTYWLFAFTAIVHHLIWSIFWMNSGISVIHYPIDMMIAIAIFVTVWFRNYFKTYQETQELAKRLREVNIQKDQFLANTSHEFRNPLHAILNMSESVLNREKDQLNIESKNQLETISSVGRRLNLLLNDLLDVMSIQEGRPKLNKKTVSLPSVVTGVKDMLQSMFETKQVKVIDHFDKEFPRVFADENRIIQILFNILHNAIKYTDEGEIVINGDVKNGFAYVTVKDTGIGMSKDLLNRIFLPYEQNESSMVEGGFGLGLSISKQLVELHGGKLTASSEVGVGTEVTFSLPLATQAQLEAEFLSEQSLNNENVKDINQAAVQPDSLLGIESNLIQREAAMTKNESIYEEARETHLGEFRLKNQKQSNVLIVDDDPINLKILKLILEDHAVYTAMNGEEALELIDRGDVDFHIVITDVMMPKMSGYQLTQEIRSRYSITELPILLLTARNNAYDIEQGFRAGANDYIVKPVGETELLARINSLTTIKHAISEQLHLETAWLQAQIKPHFLFNTLNAILALSMTDLEKMRRLLEELSHILRHKFVFQNTNTLIPIEEELTVVKSYLFIETVRFSNKFSVEWEVDDGVTNVEIPFLTIQPLVENAIEHGLKNIVQDGKVTVRIKDDDDHIKIFVEDNGEGMSTEDSESMLTYEFSNHQGVALINIHQRLVQHFGTGLQIDSAPNKGTTVSFKVPK